MERAQLLVRRRERDEPRVRVRALEREPVGRVARVDVVVRPADPGEPRGARAAHGERGVVRAGGRAGDGRSEPRTLAHARISKTMPGPEAVPVILSVELSKHATVGVGRPGSAATE